MATRESNVIMFPRPIDPERKEDVKIAKQFLEKIDGLMMKGLLRDLAAAEAKVLAGDAGAARDVEFLFVSIRRRLPNATQLGERLLRDTRARGPKLGIFGAHDGARVRRRARGASRSKLRQIDFQVRAKLKTDAWY